MNDDYGEQGQENARRRRRTRSRRSSRTKETWWRTLVLPVAPAVEGGHLPLD